MAGAPKGNKNGTKLKDPEIRQKAYQQYCAWIAEGKSRTSWSFEHPEFTCTFKTMDRYIRENPIEFPIIHKEIAEAKGLTRWEELGEKMMLGEIKGAQPAIFQMFMRNKFGWDKEERNSESHKDQASSELDRLRAQTRPSPDTVI